MDCEAQSSDGRRRSIKLILGILTVVLLVFFTIPSIPGWWAVFNLRGLQVRLQEAEKQLAIAEDALEKLEAKKLMSPSSDPSAQEHWENQIRAKKKEEVVIRAARDEDKRRIEMANEKINEASKEWWKTLLEFGGLVGVFFHSIDGVKRIWCLLKPVQLAGRGPKMKGRKSRTTHE